jgi:hypothetical protein
MSDYPQETTVKVARARPITAVVLGLIAGLALAVILQQGGVWPLDKLTVFLLPGLVALIFILIARVGRIASPVALTVALILLIAPVAYGLTGIGEVDESGQLNGGCTVEAFSNVDTTVVTDTSRSNPFVIEPAGPLSWTSTSPGPITDHVWEIYVVIGGFNWVVASGADANSDMDIVNEGNEPSLEAYVEQLTGQTGEQIRGIYEVGGFIGGTGGECDGFGFVKIDGDFFSTIISWIALAVLVLSLLIFLLIAFTGRTRPLDEEIDDPLDSDATLAAVGGGAGAASVAAADEGSDLDGGPASVATPSEEKVAELGDVGPIRDGDPDEGTSDSDPF